MLGLLMAYLVIPGILAYTAVLDRYIPLPAPALVLLFSLTVLTVIITCSSVGGRLLASVSIRAIIGLQAFRVGVELLLHRLYVEGFVPVQMTYAGRNFDVISGVTGVVLAAWLWRGRPVPRGLVLVWNTLGLALLVNIVAVAILSTPVSFRRFTEGPPNILPSTFPWGWLPSFLVQVAWGSHLVVFRQLWRRVKS